jgi:hypothetical protein
MQSHSSCNTAQLLEWKQVYGTIFSLTLQDVEYILRPLTALEVASIEAIGVEPTVWLGPLLQPSWSYYEFDGIENLVDLCTLWKSEDDQTAGAPSTIFYTIFQCSIFDSLDSWKARITYARESALSRIEGLKIFIHAGFPSYKPEELDAMSFHKLIDLAARAESILAVRQSQATLDPFMEAPKEESGGIDFDADNKEFFDS